jgi:hypothetical protein
LVSVLMAMFPASGELCCEEHTYPLPQVAFNKCLRVHLRRCKVKLTIGPKNIDRLKARNRDPQRPGQQIKSHQCGSLIFLTTKVLS